MDQAFERRAYISERHRSAKNATIRPYKYRARRRREPTKQNFRAFRYFRVFRVLVFHIVQGTARRAPTKQNFRAFRYFRVFRGTRILREPRTPMVREQGFRPLLFLCYPCYRWSKCSSGSSIDSMICRATRVSVCSITFSSYFASISTRPVPLMPALFTDKETSCE